MQFITVLYSFLIGLVALLAEMILPPHFPLLESLGLGSALLPLVIICASLLLGDERAPILAAALGLLLDLASDKHFGISVLILASLSALLMTQAHTPLARWWVFRLTCVLVGTFGFLTVDYLFILLETSRWTWPLDVWQKITLASLCNLALAPFAFWLLQAPGEWLRRRPAETERKRRYAHG